MGSSDSTFASFKVQTHASTMNLFKIIKSRIIVTLVVACTINLGQ